MFRRIFLTGDCHGQFKRIKRFCERMETNTEDLLIILGDVGVHLKDKKNATIGNKKYLSKLPISLLCIRGNHESRPEECSMVARWIDEFKTEVYWDPNYPNLYFPKSGEIYINGARCLVCDGAYSVDKEHRLLCDWFWDPHEQMYEEEKVHIRALIQENPNFVFVFSHTCPSCLVPTELFLNQINQDSVDYSMENFLQEVYDKISLNRLKHWYFGHYHGDKHISDKATILYTTYEMLDL